MSRWKLSGKWRSEPWIRLEGKEMEWEVEEEKFE